MNWLEAIIIAIVEGITEFLPISSTGHMIITEKLLGIESTEFVKAFTVIIQLGAILSVVVLYWKRFFKLNPCKIFAKEEVEGKPTGTKFKIYLKRFLYKYEFYCKLFVGVIPVMVLGVLFNDIIDLFLEKVWIVGLTLLLGGIVMLFTDKWFAKTDANQQISYKKSFIIGLFQCIAMIPGVSRSMASIVGGMSQKLTRKNAAEFSFFLAVPTMFGATVLKLYKLIKDPVQLEVLKDNVGILLLGNAVAFIVALLAIKFFINYLSKHGFRVFGIYRIIVGCIILILMACNVSLNLV